MQITIFGASGTVGQQLVRAALAEGHVVIAFVHSHDPFLNLPPELHIIKGSVSDPVAVQATIKGSEAVVSTLGSWHTKQKNILVTGMQSIIPAMEKEHIRRIITLTGAGAFYEADRPTKIDRLNHVLLGLIAPKILQDGEEHLQLLTASTLEWTSLRAPIMTNGRGDSYKLQLNQPSPIATIPRATIVRALLDQLEDTTWLRRAPVIIRS